MIQQVQSWVTTEGFPREASNISVEREITATTPASVGTPGGILAATASVVLHEPEEVSTHKRSPWDTVDKWPPRDGDKIAISANLEGTDDQELRFEGTIEDVDGTAQGPDIRVSAVDPIRRLLKNLRFNPQARGMPLPATFRTTSYSIDEIDPQVRHEWFVERALNAGGWHSTRRAQSGALHVPLVGGLWDDYSGDYPRMTGAMYNHRVQYVGFRNTLGMVLDFRDNPVGGRVGQWDKSINSRNNVIHFSVGFWEEGPARQEAAIWLGTGQSAAGYVYILARGSNLVIQTRDGTNQSDLLINKQTPWKRDDLTADVTVERTSLYTRLYIDGELEAEGPAPSSMTADHVRLFALSGTTQYCTPVLSGVIIGTASEAVISKSDPDVVYHLGNIYQDSYTGTPFWSGKSLDFLRHLAEATASSAWIDREGRFHWAHPDAFSASDSTLELTSDADLIDLSWVRSVRNSAFTVEVEHKVPEVTTNPFARVVLWEGEIRSLSRSDVGSGHSFTQIATPASDESWFFEGFIPSVEFTESTAGFSLARGNWVGASGSHEDETFALAGAKGDVSTEITDINSQARRVVVSITIRSVNVTEVQTQVYREFFPDVLNGRNMERWQGSPLPVLRGFGKIQWATETTPSGIVNINGVEDYTHSAGEWVQNGDVERLAVWLGTQMLSTNSRPLLQDLPIIPRHDVELGQVITISEDQVYGVKIHGLVVGIKEDYLSGEARMRLTVRVLGSENLPLN